MPMRADIYDKTWEKNDIGRITVLQYVYVLKNRDPDLWSATDTVYWGDFFRWTCGHWCVICSIDQRNKVSQVKDKIADELLIGLYTSMFYQIQTILFERFQAEILIRQVCVFARILEWLLIKVCWFLICVPKCEIPEQFFKYFY